MSKRKNTAAPTTPTDTADSGVLSLATLNDLDTPQRVELYVATESKQRLGFLLQGKILFTLGDEGLELLRAAGIKPGSLHNARKAEWVLRTFTGTDALKNFLLHDGTSATAFTEAHYDDLTLLQCELLQKAFTRMGQVPFRPDHQTARDICAAAEWDDNLECYFENGCTLAEQERQQAEAEAEVQAERERQQRMTEQVNSLMAAGALTTDAAGNLTAPPPPVVAFNEPEPVVTTTAEPAAANIVAFQVTAIEEESPLEDEQEAGTHEVEETEEETDADERTADPVEDEAEAGVTPEEIGSAVADAVAGMAEYTENGPVCIDSALSELEDDIGNLIDQCDVGELHGFAARLETLLTLVRGHIAAKAAPQAELPAPKVKAKRGSKKPALAAA